MYTIRDHHKLPNKEWEHHDGESLWTNDEKFKILVETLGEVIVDYMKKKE
jgi:hypothetical protein